MFIRRYLSDRVHRLREDNETTWCNRTATALGERMPNPTKLGRCEFCEGKFKRESQKGGKR